MTSSTSTIWMSVLSLAVGVLLGATFLGSSEQPADEDVLLMPSNTEGLQASLERIEALLARSLAGSPALRGEAVAPADGGGGPVGGPSPAVAPVPPQAAQPAEVVVRGPAAKDARFRPPDLEAVEAIGDWDKDDDLRQRMLLTSQAEILRIYGTPSAVRLQRGMESWIYTYEGREGYHEQRVFRFLRGRLIRIDP